MANTSILAAFERMWQHVVIALSNKSDIAHNHNDVYYTESEIDTKLSTNLGTAKSYTDGKTSNLISVADADDKVSAHNTSSAAHNDLRLLINELSNKLNAFLDIDEEASDQLSEVLALIKQNKDTLASLTSNKINVSDIIDNLETASADKVLSANQGVVIQRAITDLHNALSTIEEYADNTFETKVDASNKYTESKAYTDTEVAKKAVLGSDGFYRSRRDFINGTLITTNIDYSKSSGCAWLMEIKGNAYSGGVPFDLMLQGYIYNDSMINCHGISNGNFFDNIVAFCYNGVLCFWFPTLAYWQGFAVRVTDEMSNGPKSETVNCVVSITDEAKPTDITKEVSFVGLISNSITSKNIASQSVNYANNTAKANQAYYDGTGDGIRFETKYETKTDASSKLTEAKTFATSEATRIKNELLNGAGGAYDTLKELGDLIDDNTDAITALEIVATGKADKIHTHTVADITDLTATAEELNYMSGVNYNVQTQLNEKSNISNTVDLVSNQTVSGVKTFSNGIIVNNVKIYRDSVIDGIVFSFDEEV